MPFRSPRTTNTAIRPRVSVSSGQYCVALQPFVIPTCAIFRMSAKNGSEDGTSVKYGVGG